MFFFLHQAEQRATRRRPAGVPPEEQLHAAVQPGPDKEASSLQHGQLIPGPPVAAPRSAQHALL